MDDDTKTAKALLERYAANIEKLEYLLEAEDDSEYIVLYKNLIIENDKNIEKLKKQYPELLLK